MDYELIPHAQRMSLNTRMTISSMLAYLTAAGFMVYWNFFQEPEIRLEFPVWSVLIPAGTVLLGAFMTLKLYYGLRPQSVKLNEEGIHFVHKKRTDTIPFHTVKEILIYPEGEILIFTKDTVGTGPYAITEELTDKTMLEVLLARKIEIERPHRLPFYYNPALRFVLALVACFAIDVIALSSDRKAILLTAGGYFIYSVYTLALVFGSRHKGKGLDIYQLISILVISFIILIRVAFVL